MEHQYILAKWGTAVPKTSALADLQSQPGGESSARFSWGRCDGREHMIAHFRQRNVRAKRDMKFGAVKNAGKYSRGDGFYVRADFVRWFSDQACQVG